MTEAEPDQRPPDANPPATGSWVPGAPLDAAAEATPSYPLGQTASFATTPSSAQRDTVKASPIAVPEDLRTPTPPSTLPEITGYRVLRVLGCGGMGTVFKAIDSTLDRVVAIKVINSGWAHAAGILARFEREVKTLAQIKHPNIVPVYHAGIWQGLPYLTMEFVPGKTLHHHLERVRGDTTAACRLMIQVASAIHFLHKRGIIHRDLKPLNILLAADDTPMVADFGLARMLDEDAELTLSLAPVGTRQYMSPEQTYGGKASHTSACDIWALGVVLYELLSGCRPFSHDDPVELFRQIRHEPIPRMSAELHVPPGLEAIARKCLQKHPADRFATAADVASHLERWLAGETTSVQGLATPLHAPSALVPPAPVRRGSPLVAVGVFAVIALIVLPAAIMSRVVPGLEPSETHVARKSLAERVAAGEKVKLTDEWGKPTLDVTPFPRYPLFNKDEEGFHVFTCGVSPRLGMVELAKEPLALPLRIECEVAIKSSGPMSSAFGVTVGGRSWPGGLVPHRSHIRVGLSPRLPKQPGKWELVGLTELYWWDQDNPGSRYGLKERGTPWEQEGVKKGDWRFAPIVIEVCPTAITASVDGKPFDYVWSNRVRSQSIPDEEVRSLLTGIVRNQERVGAYEFTPPIFGPGIGVYCLNADGVVRNLTVSKLER